MRQFKGNSNQLINFSLKIWDTFGRYGVKVEGGIWRNFSGDIGDTIEERGPEPRPPSVLCSCLELRGILLSPTFMLV